MATDVVDGKAIFPVRRRTANFYAHGKGLVADGKGSLDGTGAAADGKACVDGKGAG